MILEGFKKKSNEKYLNKLLSERHVNVSDNKIESLGVILNVDEKTDLELFGKLAEDLKIHPNKLKIITFSENVKDDINSWDNCYNPKDFGWKGRIKNIELQLFLDLELDALISYYEKEILELKLITASSNAKMKIGIFQNDERINDLIIKTKLKEFDVFKTELFKYLTILNKI
tara:strand:+ start:1046 stop:1564 length:519 start_codon:yes stop_codon:yes gene_type:complete